MLTFFFPCISCRIHCTFEMDKLNLKPTTDFKAKIRKTHIRKGGAITVVKCVLRNNPHRQQFSVL